MENNKRKCYIAKYSYSEAANDEVEEILFEDSYFSSNVESEWGRLVKVSNNALLRCWYCDDSQTILLKYSKIC